MRLFFLSNTRNNTNKEIIDCLRSWIKPKARIAYFSSAPDPSRKYFLENVDWFGKIIDRSNLHYLDVNSSMDEIKSLKKADAIFLGGGNTYHLLQALRNTRADQLLKQVDVPIIGVSAGGICLTQDIRIATAENDIGATDHQGLGLVDFGFYPHYVADEVCQTEINSFMELTKTKVVLALPEYSGIAVTKGGVVHLGEVIRFLK